MKLKDSIRLVTPPIFIDIGKWILGDRVNNENRITGDYSSWDEAVTASTGYDNEIILEKTRTALLKVKNGEAVYERDSVLFDEIEYSWPLLAGLMWMTARSEGTLNVLDFGGSLGSTYYQNRAFLSSLPRVRWNIIEQARHVEIGKVWFEDDHLHFYHNITECLADTQPNVMIFSSVLQYLEHPYTVMDQIMENPCDCIIIDRTPFYVGQTDRLCVQVVSSSIYPSSYPSWIFSKSKFHSSLREGWEILVTYDNTDKIAGPFDFSYQGAIIVRKTNLS